MADELADSVLLEARGMQSQRKERLFEQRPDNSRVLDAYTVDREMSVPNLDEIRQAQTQTTKVNYLDNLAYTVNTATGCDPTAEYSGSSILTATWAKKSVTVGMRHDQLQGNDYSAARILSTRLWLAEKSIWESLNTTLVADLDADRNTTDLWSATGSKGTWDDTDDLMEIDSGDSADFYNNMLADMMAANWNGPFDHVHDMIWTADRRKNEAQGAGNSTNTSFQFSDGVWASHPTVDIDASQTINGQAYTSIGYIIPRGAVSILDWNDPKCRKELRKDDSQYWGTYQSLWHPEFTFDLMTKLDCADTSSDGGTTQDLVTKWELTLNYSLLTQPQATGAPIIKTGVKT